MKSNWTQLWTNLIACCRNSSHLVKELFSPTRIENIETHELVMEMGQVAAKCWMREFRNTKKATSKNFSGTNGIYCWAQLDERDHLNLLGTFAINDFAIPFVILHCIFYVCFACFLRIIRKHITCLAIQQNTSLKFSVFYVRFCITGKKAKELVYSGAHDCNHVWTKNFKKRVGRLIYWQWWNFTNKILKLQLMNSTVWKEKTNGS